MFSAAFPVLPEESAASPEVLQAFPEVLSAVREAVHEEAREEDYEAALPAVFPEEVPDWLLRKCIRRAALLFYIFTKCLNGLSILIHYVKDLDEIPVR